MSSEQNPNGKRSPIITILIISLVLGGGIFLLNRVITASAASSDYALMLGTYPNLSGSRIDSCSLCHTSAPLLNAYGAAYKALGRGNANSFHMIEALDSDGDGFTNIQEINALTFPGNAADFPQAATNTPTSVPPTATPTKTSVPPTPTNTGVPPTATNTGVPPTATSPGNPPPATATPAPTTQPTVAPSTEPTGEPTMKATRTGEPKETETETEEPAKTSQPRATEHPKETERPERTKVAMTRTPYPSRTPRATRVYPTRQVTPTMVCVKDDSSQKQGSYTFTGSSEDGNGGIHCQNGYHVLGDYSYDFTNYFIKPFYNFYSRRNR